MPNPPIEPRNDAAWQSTSRLLIAGNWKMNGSMDALTTINEIAIAATSASGTIEVVLFPPTTLLAPAINLIRPHTLRLGGQDCSSEATGACTGEISAEMLADAGANFVLVGHSERRKRHGETDDSVRQKALQAVEAGLFPIICIGESSNERAAQKTMEVLTTQIMEAVPRTVSATSFAIAYEPLWAIGSGQAAEDRDIEDAHRHIRTELQRHWGLRSEAIPILYGGSVSPSNCSAILALPGVNGLLVGGASLNSGQFSAIIACAAELAGRSAE